MRFLVRLISGGQSRERFLASVRSIAKSLGAEARNPKWTSYGALEIDIFSPTRADYDLFLAAVSPVYRIEFSRDLNIAPVYRMDAEIVAEAKEYFNSERYWECHETLESLWRIKRGEEKHLLQGLILLCAAFVHHQKGQDSVALSVLGRAMVSLDSPLHSYQGLDVVKIKERAAAIASAQEFSGFTI
jgi:predicted metal-dependent hydrolase